jgi:hypothetical protein
MTLRRTRVRSTSNSSSWGRTLAIAVLALVVSAAPRAADLCDATCARAQRQANGHAESRESREAGARARAIATSEATATAPAEHCAKHAAAGRVLASAHGCQTHTHLLHVAATDPGVMRTGAAESGSAVQARLSAPPPPTIAIALFLPAAPPPRLASRVARLSPESSRSHPLAFALALRI